VTDPYRISEAPQAPAATSPSSPSSGLLRPLLWVLLVISAAGDIVTSSIGAHVAISAAFGLATLGLGTALVLQHYRNRRS
jgi:hypothetical protein